MPCAARSQSDFGFASGLSGGVLDPWIVRIVVVRVRPSGSFSTMRCSVAPLGNGVADGAVSATGDAAGLSTGMARRTGMLRPAAATRSGPSGVVSRSEPTGDDE
jgi:hypothetical protein